MGLFIRNIQIQLVYLIYKTTGLFTDIMVSISGNQQNVGIVFAHYVTQQVHVLEHCRLLLI